MKGNSKTPFFPVGRVKGGGKKIVGENFGKPKEKE